MLLHLVCVFVIGIPLILGYFGNRNSRVSPVTNENTKPAVVANDMIEVSKKSEEQPDSKPALSDEKDGISITVEIEKNEKAQTSFLLNMNNHAYDLSMMDIGGLSHLNDIPASSYELIDSQIGGHHAKARITFPTSATGELHIGLNEEISFYFTL